MAVISPPDKLLSLEEWNELPEEESRRYELAEGVVQVNPKPVPRHQLAVSDLRYQMRNQLPAGFQVIPDVEVVIFGAWPPTVRAPDLAVVSIDAVRANPARFPAADVLLAVEVLSPGSVRTDRVTKFAEYADAGIPHYWLLDLEEPVTLTAYRLADGTYQQTGESSGTLRSGQPFPLSIDVPALLP
jgi:Uma2 family endonuclease